MKNISDEVANATQRINQAFENAKKLLAEWLPPDIPSELLPDYFHVALHPADIVSRRVSGLQIVEGYIDNNTEGIARHSVWWGGSISTEDEKGPIEVSLQKVLEMALNDEELEALMFHEMVHAVIHQCYGIDLERDDEREVDEWMRDNGFERHADLIEGIAR